MSGERKVSIEEVSPINANIVITYRNQTHLPHISYFKLS